MVQTEGFDLDDDMAFKRGGFRYVFVDVGGWFAGLGKGDGLHIEYDCDENGILVDVAWVLSNSCL